MEKRLTVNDGTRILERDALADSVRTSIPTSIDQPDIRLVLLELLCQHLGVFDRMPDEEGLSKASRKGSLRFLDTFFSTSNLGSVPTEN